MKMHGEWRYSSNILDLGTRWRWVVSLCRCHVTLGKQAPSTHWIGGWLGPRAGLDAARNWTPIPQPSNPQPVTIPIHNILPLSVQGPGSMFTSMSNKCCSMKLIHGCSVCLFCHQQSEGWNFNVYTYYVHIYLCEIKEAKYHGIHYWCSICSTCFMHGTSWPKNDTLLIFKRRKNLILFNLNIWCTIFTLFSRDVIII
jgi:hypothetical protein